MDGGGWEAYEELIEGVRHYRDGLRARAEDLEEEGQDEKAAAFREALLNLETVVNSLYHSSL